MHFPVLRLLLSFYYFLKSLITNLEIDCEDGSSDDSEESVNSDFFYFIGKNKEMICQILQNADDGKALLEVSGCLTALNK